MSGVIVCSGVNRQYQARAHYYAARRYELLGSPTRSRRVALRRLADAMDSGRYNRGDVLMTADYYDPVPVFEMVRR